MECFSENNVRWGLFFLSKNITLDGAHYLEVLEQYMLPIWDIHQCHDFLHDGTPAHKSKLVKMLQEDREIRSWEWPGNFPYLKPIENAWNFMMDIIIISFSLSAPSPHFICLNKYYTIFFN